MLDSRGMRMGTGREGEGNYNVGEKEVGEKVAFLR